MDKSRKRLEETEKVFIRLILPRCVPTAASYGNTLEVYVSYERRVF
jgi:hypothetical protein